MAQSNTLPVQELVCRPGDITVTQVPTGFLIGRVLPERGRGPWWEYITLIYDWAEAKRCATGLARRFGTHAWLHRGGKHYEAIGA